MDETREERFKRLARSRGERLIREIRLLGNLSNKKNYQYSEDAVNALFGPIEEELRHTKSLFFKDGAGRFRFDDDE